ncbi:hypothetical protein, partial [Clostridium paraputrificum]
MNEEIKDFLVGISRIYIDSKNGTLLDQFKKYAEIKEDNDISARSLMYSRYNVLSETQNADVSELERAE